MLILMAGLPGTGKTTLCCRLAERLSGTVLNKDSIRAAIFAPEDIEYSTLQDDLCMRVALDAAAYILSRHPGRFVFLDGRPFSRRYQIEDALNAAASLNQPWRILECICTSETARRRLSSQFVMGEHPAANRNSELYSQVNARFEEILFPKTVLNTDQPLEACIALALAALK